MIRFLILLAIVGLTIALIYDPQPGDLTAFERDVRSRVPKEIAP